MNIIEEIRNDLQIFTVNNKMNEPTHLIIHEDDFECIKKEVESISNIKFTGGNKFQIFGKFIVRTKDIEPGKWFFTTKKM